MVWRVLFACLVIYAFPCQQIAKVDTSAFSRFLGVFRDFCQISPLIAFWCVTPSCDPSQPTVKVFRRHDPCVHLMMSP